MPTSVSGKNRDSSFYTKRKLSGRLHIFCKQNAPPGRRNGMFFGRNRGHVIIIYSAFTGFPVADASFSSFLCVFFSQKPRAALFPQKLARVMLQIKHLVPFAIRVLPRTRWEVCFCRGRLLLPAQRAPDCRTQIDGSALFRVFGRGRLF